MKPVRRLVLAALAAGLFVLALIVATAGLMLAGEPGASGSGRSPEERVVVLLVLLLVALAFSGWVIYRLYELYASAPLRMAEEVMATLAHIGLRVGEHGAAELHVLGQAVNQLLALREASESFFRDWMEG